MVLTSKIRIITGSALLLILTVCFSCEESFPGLILCTECSSDEPVGISLELKLSAGLYNNIHIEVYEGNLEDSILYKAYETAATRSTVPVILNKKYTVVARYYIPDDYFLAVNSVTPHTIYDESQCEKPCYYVRDKVVDLRLKRVK